MSSFDLIFLVVIAFGAFRGYRAGFLMEIITFLAIILGIVGGFKLLGSAMLWLDGNFKINNSILPYLAFAAVFVIIVIGVSFLGRMIKSSIDKSFLGSIDQAMGAMIGLIKITFLASLILWIMTSLSITLPDSLKRDSWFYPITESCAPLIISWIGKIFPVFKDIL